MQIESHSRRVKNKSSSNNKDEQTYLDLFGDYSKELLVSSVVTMILVLEIGKM